MPNGRTATVSLPPSLALLAGVRAVRLDESVANILHRAVTGFAALAPADRARLLGEYQWSGLARGAWQRLNVSADTFALIVLCAARAWKTDEIVVASLAWYLTVP